MVVLVKGRMLSDRSSYKCNKTLVVVVCTGLEKSRTFYLREMGNLSLKSKGSRGPWAR